MEWIRLKSFLLLVYNYQGWLCGNTHYICFFSGKTKRHSNSCSAHEDASSSRQMWTYGISPSNALGWDMAERYAWLNSSGSKVSVRMVSWDIVPWNSSHTRSGSRLSKYGNCQKMCYKNHLIRKFSSSWLMWCSLVWNVEGLATSFDFLLGVLYWTTQCNGIEVNSTSTSWLLLGIHNVQWQSFPLPPSYHSHLYI